MGIRWFKHVSKLPAWASETKYLNKARWIEEKVFGSITTNVVQKSKEVRLEEKRNEGRKIERPIFPEKNDEETYILYGTLEEHTQEIVIKQFSLKDEEVKEEKTQTSERSLESRKVEVDESNNESYDHLNNQNNSVERKEAEIDEGNQTFLHGKERAESFPMYHRDESNKDIQHISEMSEKVHIT